MNRLPDDALHNHVQKMVSAAIDELRPHLVIDLQTMLAPALAELQRDLVSLREEVACLKGVSANLQRQHLTPAESSVLADYACWKTGNMTDSAEETTELSELEEQQELIELDLPESLFSFCMASLAAKPDSWMWPSLLLVLQFTIQIVLGWSFFVAQGVRNVESHFSTEHSDIACFYPDLIFGIPFQDLVASLLSLLLISFCVRADDCEALSTVYPDDSAPLLARGVANLAWFLQSWIVPLTVCQSASSLMVGSEDTTEVVMNALAITFILEVDDMLYATVLSRQECEDYMAQKHVAGEQDEYLTRVGSWILFIVTYALMVYCYLDQLRTNSLFGPEYYTITGEGAALTAMLTFLISFARLFVLTVIWTLLSEPVQECKLYFKALVRAVCWFLGVIAFGMILAATGSSYDPSHFESCVQKLANSSRA